MVDSLAIIDTCDAEYCRNNWLGSAADKKIVTLADEGRHKEINPTVANMMLFCSVENASNFQPDSNRMINTCCILYLNLWGLVSFLSAFDVGRLRFKITVVSLCN